MSSAQPAYEPPGPGPWDIDAVHFPRPVTRYWSELHPEPFERGFGEFAGFYGMLIAGRENRYVNGFAYGTTHPVAGEDVPARLQRAAETFERKLWREQLQEWDETCKPESIRRHRELQAVDVEGLSDDELAAYLTECRDHHAEMIYQHMRFTAAPSVPTGDFLAHVGDWTGLPASELLPLMRGAAPVSAGVTGELERMVAAFEEDAEARELLASDGDPAEVLEALRSRDSEVGRAAGEYLDLVGNRLLDGFDISNQRAIELPDALLRSIRIAIEGRGDVDADVEGLIADVRAKVPEEHRDAFDELLGEARLMARLRDERGVFSDIWASGIMRRAALGAGERVAAAGRVHEPLHFLEAGLEEMCALVSRTDGPSADELAERFADRTSRDAKTAPPHLGPPTPAPPDMSGLPPAGARVMRAMGIVLDAMFAPSQAPHEERRIRGLGASKGRYEGIARRVAGSTEFDRIVAGDVLLTEATTEAFNILLPLLGAIVTDSGGLLSHAALVAREYGIPGVVGTRNATDLIPDGARVRVDGDAGAVTVLE
ncbi:MAG TPA: PEP-utilizing enzyme [Solirubrobacteraceae bacterium]|nr:PEP-utilizing enzyme [Solirubrobacteraceae bacterium]